MNYPLFRQPQFNKLVAEFRTRIFEEVAESNIKGLIFTYVWALDHESDKNQVDKYCKILKKKPEEVYFVELYATQKERLARNKTELRLKHKKSKNNLMKSEKNLLDCDNGYVLNSNNDFFYQNRYLKIDNTNLSALETAKIVMDNFKL